MPNEEVGNGDHRHPVVTADGDVHGGGSATDVTSALTQKQGDELETVVVVGEKEGAVGELPATFGDAVTNFETVLDADISSVLVRTICVSLWCLLVCATPFVI